MMGACLTHLSKHTEWATPRVNLERPWALGDSDVSLWVLQLDHCTFCRGTVAWGEAVCVGGGRRLMGSLCIFHLVLL